MLMRFAHSLNTSEQYQLLAGGSIGHPPATVRPRFERRLWLITELGLFLIGVPLLMRWAIHDLHIPLFLVLQPLLLGFVAYLLWDDTFHVRRELTQRFAPRHLVWIALVFACVGGVITIATAQVFPDRFLGFPLYRPNIWLLVLLVYPLLSVIPQELVYRTFFFHRYGPLFGGARWFAILANGALFGFAHIIFNNWIAVAGSAVVGTIIAYRYWMTRSFWAAWLEHSLYGCLVFTVGLGMFFFTGVSNF
jgi:hypothetical protein